MAENINVTYNIKNVTGNRLVVSASNLEWGKFVTQPVEIASEAVGSFKASGRKSSASGTEGSATFTAFDGTEFIFNWNISWGTKANSATISTGTTAGRGNPTHFAFHRYDSTFTNILNGGDVGSSPVVLYYMIKHDG